MPRLSVNIDHVATLRQARRGAEPDPLAAAVLVELAGADGVTVHLREDRRHIQDRDLELLRATTPLPLNLEMAATEAMASIARHIKPQLVTLVPEGRQEITTEGGLDVVGNRASIGAFVAGLKQAGLRVSMFVDPDAAQVRASQAIGADCVELHTGEYAHAHARHDDHATMRELQRLAQAALVARECALELHAGHGLNYRNVAAVAAMPDVAELAIGHAIVSRAVLVGMERAVREMLVAMR